jgi:hypothetical protein
MSGDTNDGQPETGAAQAVRVSVFRLWIMRLMYLVMAAGIANMTWPSIISHGDTVPRMTGVAFALIGTIGLLSVLGLRYPLRMLPLLLFEFTWKLIWLVAFAAPRWLNGSIDDAMRATTMETALGGILLLVIPWRYVWANYVIGQGDPWLRSA